MNFKTVLIIGACSFFGFFFLILILIMCILGDEESVVKANFKVPFKSDVVCTITSHYGYRVDPVEEDIVLEFHSGIDITAPQGTDIVSSADGTVYQVGYDGDGLGNYVYLEHKIDNKVMYTIYGHMLDDSIVVKKGDEVKAQDKLGTIGATGRVTGTHLHFMISKDKISFDEEDLIDPFSSVSSQCKEVEA